MKIENRTETELTEDQITAINVCEEILNRGFGLDIFKTVVNPNAKDTKKPFSVSFAFNLKK